MFIYMYLFCNFKNAYFQYFFDKTVVFSSKVMSQINSGSGIKKKLFNMALASKENELKK